MAATLSDDELLAFIDEMLPSERAAECEALLRTSPELRQRVALLIRRRDQGGHSVGEIWRRLRLSCLSRSELGSWLLGTLDDGLADYVDFHLHAVGCRVCAANLEDLRQSQAASAQPAVQWRSRIFESSAGLLRSKRPE